MVSAIASIHESTASNPTGAPLSDSIEGIPIDSYHSLSPEHISGQTMMLNSASTDATRSFTDDPAPGAEITSRPMDSTNPTSSSLAAFQSLSISDRPRMFTEPFRTSLLSGEMKSITAARVWPQALGAGMEAIDSAMCIALSERPLSSIDFE